MRIACLLIVFAACSSTPKTYPTPITYQEDGVDPYATTPATDRKADVQVFYATDRAPVEDEDPGDRYGGRGIALRLGSGTVHVGTDETWAEVHEKLRASERLPVRVTDVHEYGRLWTTIPTNDPDYDAATASRSGGDAVRKPAREFADAINKRIARTKTRDVIVYVPGYKIDFANPLRMTAQFHHFCGRDPVFIAYSWPASGSSLTYVSDAVNAGLSVRNLREFLLFMARETKARRIHILAYSAGAPIVNDALLQLRLMHDELGPTELRAKLRIGQVIFVAPDDDVAYFRNLSLDRVGDAIEFFTLYASQSDSAMSLGRLFYFTHARLGSPGKAIGERDLQRLRENKDSALIDAENAKDKAGEGSLGHAYWYENPWVSADIVLALKYGLDPAARGLVKVHEDAIWGFPDDYPDKARAAIQPAR